MLWINKSQTLKQLHFTVFKHLRFVFAEWADWSHPDSQREPVKSLKDIVPFPYRLQPDQPVSRAEFDALTDE